MAHGAPESSARADSTPRRPDLREFLRRFQGHAFALLLFGVFTAIIFRDGIGGAQDSFPQGTNALDAFLLYNFQKHYPASSWLYPYTDWGQPLPEFTGPTLLTIPILAVSTTQLVRGLEILSFFGASVSTYYVVRSLGQPWFAGVAAGGYYAFLAETPELFEGHVPAMISLAIAPVFLFFMGRLMDRPTVKGAVAEALCLYVLTSIGDIGILYILLFFSIATAFLAALRANIARRYDRREVLCLLLGAGLYIVLILTWLLPYLAGARPQYTTNITVVVLPFSKVAGQQLYLAFIGFVPDNSFILFHYGLFTYEFPNPLFFGLYLLIPILVGLYVVSQRNLYLGAFYLSGFVAMIFSTGGMYPGLSTFNQFFYNHVPFFDSLPEMGRWNEYTIFVYAVLLGYSLSPLEKELLHFLDQARLRLLGPGSTEVALTPSRADASATIRGSRGNIVRTRGRSARRLLRTRGLQGAMLAGIVLIVMLQNWVGITEPPGTFSFPASYVDGFEYISQHSVNGSVLTIPFGAIYERTPWGGVSQSSLFMAPYFTGGADTVIFQAGVPSSLAMDQVVGNGLTDGLSNNMTKLLSAMNVQYVAATRYPNWSQASDGLYDPAVSYYALQNQTGLGEPDYSAGYQSVYTIGPREGNISFHPDYYVYFGNNSLLYEILNQPWYLGAAQVLVDGSLLPPAELGTFVSHASAVIFSPSSAPGLPKGVLATAASGNVPVIAMIDSSIVAPGSALRVRELWNASNGYGFQSYGGNVPISFPATVAPGSEAYVSARASCGPSSVISLSGSVTGASETVTQSAPVVSSLNLSNTSYIQAGINNHNEYPYNGSVSTIVSNGQPALRWNFTSDNTTLQYLDFRLTSLGGLGGLEFTVTNPDLPPLPVQMNVVLGTSGVTVTGYGSPAPSGQGTVYTFYFPSLLGSQYAMLKSHQDNISRFAIGLTSTGPFSSLTISDISWISPAQIGFAYLNLTPTPLPGQQGLDLSAPSGCTFDTVTVANGPTAKLLGAPTFDSFTGNQPDPTSVRFPETGTGWGLVVLAQTFASVWTLHGAGEALHAVGNIGLNVWLVNLTGGDEATMFAVYSTQPLVEVAGPIELGGVAVLALAAWAVAGFPPFWRRWYGPRG